MPALSLPYKYKEHGSSMCVCVGEVMEAAALDLVLERAATKRSMAQIREHNHAHHERTQPTFGRLQPRVVPELVTLVVPGTADDVGLGVEWEPLSPTHGATIRPAMQASTVVEKRVPDQLQATLRCVAIPNCCSLELATTEESSIVVAWFNEIANFKRLKTSNRVISEERCEAHICANPEPMVCALQRQHCRGPQHTIIVALALRFVGATESFKFPSQRA